MAKRLIRKMIESVEVIYHQAQLFSPVEINANEEGPYIEKQVKEVYLTYTNQGIKGFKIISQEIEKLDKIRFKLKKELMFLSEMKETGKLQKYLNYINEKINTTINNVAISTFGFIDKKGIKYSYEEYRSNRTEVLNKGVSSYFLFSPSILNSKKRIRYSQLTLAIVAKLEEYRNFYSSISIDINKLVVNDDNFPILQGPRHKLILLKEVGILKYLHDSYQSKMTNTKFAQFLSLILGVSDKASIETIRKEYHDVLHDTKPKTGKAGSPLNKDSVTAVINALKMIGISPINLPEIE